MNKVELVNAVEATKGIEMSKKDIAVVVDAVFNSLSNGLKKDGRALVPGFGTFKVRQRAARDGINPITKKPLHINAVKAVGFKPAPDLKNLVNGVKTAPKPAKPAAAAAAAAAKTPAAKPGPKPAAKAPAAKETTAPAE